MKLVNIFNENSEKDQEVIDRNKLITFFKNNPNPKDEAVHKFAEENGIEHSHLEEKIYKLLTYLLNK